MGSAIHTRPASAARSSVLIEDLAGPRVERQQGRHRATGQAAQDAVEPRGVVGVLGPVQRGERERRIVQARPHICDPATSVAAEARAPHRDRQRLVLTVSGGAGMIQRTRMSVRSPEQYDP